MTASSNHKAVALSSRPATMLLTGGWLILGLVMAVPHPLGAQPPDASEPSETPAASPIAAPPTPATVIVDDLLAPVENWFDTLGVEASARKAAIERLNARFAAGGLAPENALDALAVLLADFDPRAREMLDWCAEDNVSTAPSGWEWLMDSATAPVVRNNLRLYLGRWYAQRELYDEALHLLDQLDEESVVAPAMLLFYRSVCLHQLVESERAAKDVDRLLTAYVELPRRYDALATLIKHDLTGVKEGSLDEIARYMQDVRRRLSLGRSGRNVQDIETRIVESLHKLIDELEQNEREANSSSSSSAGGTSPSASPAADSQPLGGKGPGDVAPRDLRNEGGWGDLSPKQREEALQIISKDLPAHYRSAVEQYFRTLANQDAAEENK